MSETQNPLYRIVLIGDSAVGKTSIINQLQSNTFDINENATIGAMFILHTEEIGKSTVEMQIWDTAGQEKFKSLGPIYYRNSAAAVCVFDLTQKDSWGHVDKWVEAFRAVAGTETSIVVAGNKADLVELRQVTDEDIKQWATEKGYTYFETSARIGTNVAPLFHNLAETLKEKSLATLPVVKSNPKTTTKDEAQSSCC